MHCTALKYKLNKKRNIPCISEVCFLEMLLCEFYFMYKLIEVFTVHKVNITTEASEIMSKDQFDVRKGPNLKIEKAI